MGPSDPPPIFGRKKTVALGTSQSTGRIIKSLTLCNIEARLSAKPSALRPCGSAENRVFAVSILKRLLKQLAALMTRLERHLQ